MGEISVDLAAKVDELSSRIAKREGLSFRRFFTADLDPGKTPYDALNWETRTASIANEKGEVIFEQREVEMPRDWSQTATNIVVSKYFHGRAGTPERESSLKQLVHRVVDTIADWGAAGGYFAGTDDVENFRDELAHLMLMQKASFNSPVWFNVGVKESRGYGWAWSRRTESVKEIEAGTHRPQCSACFIISVNDTMESIMDLAKTEGMLFKWGSGAGSNLSKIREDEAVLGGGGRASGPVSFMKGFDAFAGVIKSGGKTRRAAKMVILNADHPDIDKFIGCKAREERKAWTLIGAGYDAAIDGDVYSSIFFQNANNSVRVTDEFMLAAINDEDWWTRAVVSGQPKERYKAKELLRHIAEATHQCGDPGMQFDTTVNRWHPCRNTDRINASNPCSEYMFLDDSACNLASINVMRFKKTNGDFNVEAFRHAVDTLILAQEILVDNASYPTEKIGANSHAYRPLGLGYANLGALLMSMGVPYDSDEGRDVAASITSTMCGQAYLTSARIAETVGPFAGYERNREVFGEVIRMHRESSRKINSQYVEEPLHRAAQQCWDDAYEMGRRHGYRNGQVTVLAPTGTIGFMMDCDTTGIEPELALIKYKKLVGGGVIKIVNNTVEQSLLNLGYSPEDASEIVSHIDSTGTIEGAPHLDEKHLPVFDCSFRAQNSERSIHYLGHLRMMSVVQPFISGAISKTINMPKESTVDDIVTAYVEAWRLGVKAVAIYRDGSKGTQPLNTGKQPDEKAEGAAAPVEKIVYRPQRLKLPAERQSLTHKFAVGGHEGYITVGLYENGKPGEIFIRMSKEGSTISGLMDSFATAVSMALQYGVPLRALVDKFQHVRFEPSGWTGSREIPYAKSIMDYIFRWLGSRYISPEYSQTEVGEALKLRRTEPEPQQALAFNATPLDAPICSECGSLMTSNGSCYKCENCGSTSGCS